MDKKFIINLKIIINESIYKKKLIDEYTFTYVNERLLNELSKFD